MACVCCVAVVAVAVAVAVVDVAVDVVVAVVAVVAVAVAVVVVVAVVDVVDHIVCLFLCKPVELVLHRSALWELLELSLINCDVPVCPVVCLEETQPGTDHGSSHDKLFVFRCVRGAIALCHDKYRQGTKTSRKHHAFHLLDVLLDI